MSGYVHRSAMLPGGIFHSLRQAKGLPPIEVPKDVVGWQIEGRYSEWVPITRGMMLERKREAQARHLQTIRRCSPSAWRRGQLWVFFVPGWLYAGWHCYVRALKEYWPVDFRSGPAKEWVMRQVPMGELPLAERFDKWCAAIAKAYPKQRTRTDPRRAGIVNGWCHDGKFYLTRGIDR